MGAGLYLVATKLDICHEINNDLAETFLDILRLWYLILYNHIKSRKYAVIYTNFANSHY